MRHASLISWSIALACGGSVVLAAEPAAACTCLKGVFPEAPLAHSVHPVGLPLLFREASRTATLADSAGNFVELDVVREFAGFGLCAGLYRFVRPSSALVPGEAYNLAPDPPHPDHAELEATMFIAGTSPVGHRSVEFEVAVSLQQELYLSDEAACGDRRVNDRPYARTAHVQLTVATETLLLVTATLEDPVAGPLTDVGAPWHRLDDRRFTSALPVADEANGCIDVAVFDAEAVELYQRQLCPTLEAPVIEVVSAEAADVRGASISGNEPDPARVVSEPEGLEPTRCTYGGSLPSSSWPALALVGLLTVGLRLRRVFR